MPVERRRTGFLPVYAPSESSSDLRIAAPPVPAVMFTPPAVRASREGSRADENEFTWNTVSTQGFSAKNWA